MIEITKCRLNGSMLSVGLSSIEKENQMQNTKNKKKRLNERIKLNECDLSTNHIYVLLILLLAHATRVLIQGVGHHGILYYLAQAFPSFVHVYNAACVARDRQLVVVRSVFS